MDKDSANLNFLRSIAILFVLFDHTFSFLALKITEGFDLHHVGQLGVSFFFVHTALVLMMSLERQRKKCADIRLAAVFYIRRIFRIYPLSIFFLVFILIFKIPSAYITAHVIHSQPADLWQILSNILLIQNLTNQPSIIAQYWSLPLEVQMYVVLPILFFIAESVADIRILMGVWLLIFIFLQLFQAAYIPNFMGGIVSYSLMRHAQKKIPAIAWIIFVIAMSLIYLIHPSKERGWLVCLSIGAAAPYFHEIQNMRLSRFFHEIAKYSYGMYISHVFCLWLAFVVFNNFPFYAQILLYPAILIFISYGLYYLLEKPFIDFGANLGEVFLKKTAQTNSATRSE